MKAILTLAMKDLALLLRDPMSLFFMVAFPLIFAIFFGSIFSGGGGGTKPITLLLIDEDGSEQSQAFASQLEEASEFTIVAGPSRQEAMELVRRGRRPAYLVLPDGFGAARGQLPMGPAPKVEIGIDPTRQAEAGMLKGLLTKYAFAGLQDSLQDPARIRSIVDQPNGQAAGMPEEVRETLATLADSIERLNQLGQQAPEGTSEFGELNPIQIETTEIAAQSDGPGNAYAVSFPQAIVWAILGCVSGFSTSLVAERQLGTLMRLRSAPLSRMQVLGGKTLACLLAVLAATVFQLSVARLIFGVKPSSPLLLALGLVSTAAGFAGIMMLLSVLGRTEQSAAGIGWAALMPMAMLGGGMLPLIAMPSWMVSLSDFSPVKWAVLAMEGALWRQFSLSEMLLPCAILLSVGAVCFAVGVRAFRWSEG